MTDPWRRLDAVGARSVENARALEGSASRAANDEMLRPVLLDFPGRDHTLWTVECGTTATGSGTVYAITFDLATAELAKSYPGDSDGKYAYEAIGNFLKKRGFVWQQGSVYFGDKTIDPVKCVLVVQELAAKYEWFNSAVVRDIRMLRIEDMNDLNPAITYARDQLPKPNLFERIG